MPNVPASRTIRADGLQNWFRNAGDEVEALRRAAEAKGREIYAAGIRAGRDVLARTPAELQALGARALAEERAAKTLLRNTAARGASNAVSTARTVRQKAPAVLRQAQDQIAAGGRGALDAFTFGADDHVSAALRAVAESGLDLDRLGDNYRSNMDEERARDAYDAEHYGAARMIGQGVGMAGQMVALGPLGGAARLGQVAIAYRVLPRLAGWRRRPELSPWPAHCSP